MNLDSWEKKFEQKIVEAVGFNDPAHDVYHFQRVVRSAKKLAEEEKAKVEVVIPAAWLHDLVNVPKTDPRRSQASRLSADAAIEYLKAEGYPEEYFNEIAHAIAAHSYSAKIQCESLEAKIVQDADRLDALGAIGLARCFSVSVQLGHRQFYNPDLFCEDTEPDDTKYTTDHFHIKLFKLAETMNTESGKKEAERRTQVMKRYLEDLSEEI